MWKLSMVAHLVQSFRISCHFMIDLNFIYNNNQCKYDLFNLHIIDDERKD